MKILDRYIIKNFLIGYVIAFAVLMGLRIVVDMFVNLDDFTKHADLGAMVVMRNISLFYATQSVLYFRDFAGMITVIASVFALGRMIKANEMVAIMASGLSLKRVIMPIVVMALISTGLLVINQEFIIPPLADQLVRDHDSLPGQDTYDLWFMADENASLISSQQFHQATDTIAHPTIITRSRNAEDTGFIVTGTITADSAVYDSAEKLWHLENGTFTAIDSGKSVPVAYYKTDITPFDIPVRRMAKNTSLMSTTQLNRLASQKIRNTDLIQLYSQKHYNITEPIISLVMLLISLPLLVRRDPRTMKSGVVISFGLTAACFLTNFTGKMLANEAAFGQIELWAWMPIMIFLPIAFLELEAMKT